MKQLKFISVIALSLCYLFTFNSCKKSEDSSLQLPPASSMNMDFNFTSITKSASETQTQVNYGLAAGTILIWSSIAYNLTNIPSLAFNKALENKPIYNSIDKVWEWSYVTTVGNDKYSSKLTGEISGDSVQWKMYLTKTGTGGSNLPFLWFEGKSHQGRTGGWWILNYTFPYNGSLVSDQGLKITWSYTNDQVFFLRYTNIATKKIDNGVYVDNDDKGGYIEYGRISDLNLDSYYTIHREKAPSVTYDIVWNSKNKNGQIKQNGTPIGCWDVNKEDITCSN